MSDLMRFFYNCAKPDSDGNYCYFSLIRFDVVLYYFYCSIDLLIQIITYFVFNYVYLYFLIRIQYSHLHVFSHQNNDRIVLFYITTHRLDKC